VAILEGILVDEMARLIFGIFLLFTVQFILAEDFDDYVSGFEKGWYYEYNRKTDLEKHEIPLPERVIFEARDGLSLQQQGIIDGLNAAGYKILEEKWNSYSWWEKIIDPLTWFLLTFYGDGV
jgi:hypothetical protein